MDYNQMITTDLLPVLERLIKMVDRYSDYYKIADLKLQVDDSDLTDLGNYVSTRSTCEFRIDVFYRLNNETEDRYFFLTVPRMVDGIFIIKGKYKMISKYLAEDWACRRIGDYFRLSYGFSYNIIEQLFGIYDEEIEDYRQLDFDELSEQYPEYLLLNEHQSNKLKIKLDLDYFPTQLTKEIVSRFNEIEDNPRDIIDKRIISVESILINSIRQNMLSIVKSLNHNFFNKGTISASPIQRVINEVFNGQGNNLNTLINSANVNPLSFDSTNQKIIIDNELTERLRPGNYDASMADIIDPVVTPDNANINKINMLTKAAGVKDGYIAISCYDSKFNPIQVEYTKYLASKVLLYTEVESYENRIIKNKDSYKVKLNRKERESKDFDFIEPEPDDRLSVEARMIPMINEIDSVRGAMAAKMIGQSVPLSNPDAPRVQSGHETDTELSTTDIRFESTMQGKVIKADSNSVIIMVGEIPKEYKVPSPAVGIYNITAVFTPKVKVGDIVNKGDIIITHDIAKEDIRKLGVNALVALRPYRGLNYEDGIVISKSFANKLNHYSIVDLTLLVKDNETLISLLPIGTKVKSKDVLVSVGISFKNDVSSKIVNIITSTDKSLSRVNNLVTPNTIDEGYVTDVKIFYNDYANASYGKEVNVLDENSIKIIEKFKKNKIVIPDSIPKEYRAQLPDSYDYEGFAACIRYRILSRNPAQVATKLANRYGSKGLVAKILDDSEMDRTEDGRVIDVILNSDAVIARKNIGQIPEVYLSNIADVIKKKVRNMDINEAKVILAKYKLTNYSKMEDKNLKFILESDEPLNYITGCFAKISNEEILRWTEELGMEGLTRIIDGKTGRPVRNPILVGNMYMMKLYQLPEHYNKVHSDSSDEAPVLGKGLYREESGQSQGGLETFALLASDLDEYVYETRKSHEFIDAEGIMINLRLAGINIRVKNDEDKK